MSVSDVARGRTMEARVGRTLEEAGLAVSDVSLVRAAHRLAMGLRREHLPDPRHPDFLHPGRTVLILVADSGFCDAIGLAAAALVDSERAELRVRPSRIRHAVGDEVSEWVQSVPLPGAALAEELLSARIPVQVVALAERLDQCRHAKFWSDNAARSRVHEEVETIYGPIAERTDPGLARRFAHWSRAFSRTLEREVGGPAAG